jgi:hypothetical protein
MYVIRLYSTILASQLTTVITLDPATFFLHIYTRDTCRAHGSESLLDDRLAVYLNSKIRRLRSKGMWESTVTRSNNTVRSQNRSLARSHLASLEFPEGLVNSRT